MKQSLAHVLSDTLANWTAKNPVLRLGVIAQVSDVPGLSKIGDGATRFADLPWNRTNKDGVRAASQAQLVGVIGFTDVTGLITFDVDASSPWVVEAFHPYMVAVTAALTPVIQISDQANANKARSYGMNTAVNQIAQLAAREYITAPGTYQRKLQVGRWAGTGTVTSLANTADVVAFIRAYPER